MPLGHSLRLMNIGRSRKRFVILLAAVALQMFTLQHLHAKEIASHIRSDAQLEYGTVLYQYFQRRYFHSLVEDAYVSDGKNTLALSQDGELLQGGMMLSYGMANEAKRVFDELLANSTDKHTRNRAWYFLAKFFYNKSDIANAANALSNIEGEVPRDLRFDHRYLSTLVDTRSQKALSEDELDDEIKKSRQYPYLLFNIAIGQLRQGKFIEAVKNLEKVKNYPSTREEYLVLADRAKLGLTQIAMQNGRFDQAWKYLTQIRTTGLYSNRALLSYAWAAIKIRRFNDAIAALKLLNQRSIASPEVQEAKVLLAHLYEQEGSPRKALKANLIAIKEFNSGIEQVDEARRIIAQKDVPEEFITNMEAIVDDSDWLGANPSVDYKNLTPFLIDLMAGNPFNETLRELGDLYYLRKNLLYWLRQADEHLVIMNNATQKAFDDRSRELILELQDFETRFSEEQSELKLLNLTLKESSQKRMDTLLKTTEKEIGDFSELVGMFSTLETVYTMPSTFKPQTLALHKRVKQLLQKTELSIIKMEPIMRRLVNAELDKHQERMSYYSAQSRLAKARLYDTTLSTLRDAQRNIKQENESK
ncbi:MAG: hypothetical protein K6L76_03055 [Agarilytica sp.]